MRRLSAVLLLLVTSFGLAMPLLSASASDPEAKFPPCCRRDGKHRCGMMNMKKESSRSGPAVAATTRCAQYPQGTAAPGVAPADLGSEAPTVPGTMPAGRLLPALALVAAATPCDVRAPRGPPHFSL